jgi:acetyl-CoA acyltransferase
MSVVITGRRMQVSAIDMSGPRLPIPYPHLRAIAEQQVSVGCHQIAWRKPRLNDALLVDGTGHLYLAHLRRPTLEHGLTPSARVVAGACAGVAPRIMGFGPAPATRKLLSTVGWSVGGLDVIELNEAFASQVLATLRDLGIPDDAEHANPNGGAIALGHPLGMSGARLAGTASLELRERGARRAVAAMCIGVGQGIAIALEAV